MSTQVSTKVRLVRCPKCRQVLAELPEVLLYKCGGCGTVLQAKNRGRETNTTDSSPQVTHSIAKSQQDDDLEVISSLIKDSSTRPEVESLSDKDNMTYRDENGDSEGLREGRSILSTSPKVPSSRNEDSSTEAYDLPRHDSLSQISDSTFRDDNGELSGGRDFSHEFPSSGELALDLIEQQKGDEFVNDVRNLPKHEYMESALSPEVENYNHISPENDNSSRICSADTSGDLHGEIRSPELDSSSGNVSPENESTGNDTTTSVGGSRVASRSPSKESLVSFYLMSSDSEHPDRLPTEVSRGHFGRYSSLDMSEINTAIPTPNYPKIESYYANGSSESSYDGIDNQISQRTSQPSRKSKVADIRTSAILRTKNGFHGNNKTAVSEVDWAPTSSSLHTNRTHHWKEGKPTETNLYATAENRTRLDGPGHTGYRHSSLPPRPLYAEEPDNIDLLRTVCELKDQLSRMHFPQVRRFPYDPFPLEGEPYSDARHSIGYNLRPNHNLTCLHCCPQDWRYSVQLPPNSPCRVHTKHYASSEASLWGFETKPDQQRLKEETIERVRLKEKYFAGKRHVRPVAGGAPVVTCYRCSELLCLPSDFLLFRKKCHRLMCHACKEVLRFSLREGTHIVPYIRESPAHTHPPLHGVTESVKPLSSSSAPKQTNRPVSCSDDYYNGNMSSGSSYQAVEDRKMKSILIEPENKIDESVGPSSMMPKWRKAKSEIVELSSSPLHRLMGYSSPSQVLDN